MAMNIDEPRKTGLTLTVPTLSGAKTSAERAPRQMSDHWATVIVVAVIVIAMQIGSYFVPAYILRSEEHTSELQSH